MKRYIYISDIARLINRGYGITLIAFLICFSSTNGFAQNETDSLRKYTYFILGIDINSPDKTYPMYSGSGYFIRNEGKIFFLTASHVITGCYPKDTCKTPIKPPTHPATMTIFLHSSQGVRNDNFIDIYIGHLHKILPCTNVSIDPDIFAYELRVPPTDTIYSIEKFLDRELPENKKEDICVYGFPGYANIDSFGFTIVNSTLIKIKRYNFFNNYKFKACGGLVGIDSMDYIIEPLDSFKNNLYGCSGAPGFIFNKKNKQWYFLGTITGAVEENKYVFLKPKYTLRAMGLYRP